MKYDAKTLGTTQLQKIIDFSSNETSTSKREWRIRRFAEWSWTKMEILLHQVSSLVYTFSGYQGWVTPQ